MAELTPMYDKPAQKENIRMLPNSWFGCPRKLVFHRNTSFNLVIGCIGKFMSMLFIIPDSPVPMIGTNARIQIENVQ